MRICTIIDAWEPIWGGGQTHVWEITKRLVMARGWEIDIFTRDLIDKTRLSLKKSETYLNGKLQVRRVGPVQDVFSVTGRLFWTIGVVSQIIAAHRKKPYDLIHAHAYLPAIPGKILQYLLRLPLIYTVHGSHNLDIGKNNLITIIERVLLTYLRYDCEISVNRKFLTYPNMNKNILVLENGVDVTKFDWNVSKKSTRIFRFLWVGRFDWIKAVDILLHSYKRVVTRNINVVLDLVGYGYDIDSYKKLAKALEIDRQVHFLGKKTGQELVRIYKSADVFVLPSLAEGQAVTLLEAWAAKLPVIASDAGDHKLLVKNGINGYLVRMGNEDALVAAMEKAISDPNLKKLGEHGYELVKKKYTWDIAAKKQATYYLQFVK